MALSDYERSTLLKRLRRDDYSESNVLYPIEVAEIKMFGHGLRLFYVWGINNSTGRIIISREVDSLEGSFLRKPKGKLLDEIARYRLITDFKNS